MLRGQVPRQTIDGAGLSAREIDVLELMAEGLTNEAIGNRLCLGIKSVESTIRSLLGKLDLVDNAHENRRVLAVRMFLNSAPNSVTHWPAWASQFVGREVDLDQMARLVGDHRLVTVVGVGGIGKTRAATELAERVGGDGTTVHFVDLTGLVGADVPGRLFEAFGIVLSNETSSWRRLERVLRASPRLIVLDNAETCVTETREVILRLLSAERARLLVTSREPLSVAGECLYRIPPLTDDDARQLMRARIADAGTDVGTLDSASLSQLLGTLSGIPLAIELVAARFASSGIEDIVGRTGRLTDLLVRQGNDRHASLHATLGTSYRALDPDAQGLFRQLSVFVVGFTREMAVQFLGSHGSTVDDGLDRLVRASLLGFSRGRYRMLEPVRQYAGELLHASPERVECASKLVSWCVQRTTDALKGYSEAPSAWRRSLDPEAANIDAALEAALSAGDLESALMICKALCWYWASERPGAALSISEKVVSHLDGTESETSRAWGLLNLGNLRCRTWEPAGGEQPLTEAARLFQQHGDKVGLALAFAWLPMAGRPDLVDRAIETAIDASLPEAEAYAYVTKANMMAFGRPESEWNDIHLRSEIDDLLNKAEAIADHHDYKMVRFQTQLLRVRIRFMVGYNDRSLPADEELAAMMAELEAIARSIGNHLMIASALRERNIWRMHVGRYGELHASLPEQLELSSLTDERLILACGALLNASLLDINGSLDEAHALIAAAAPIHRSLADPSWMQYSLRSAELFHYATQHLNGPILDNDQLITLTQAHSHLIDAAV